MLLCAGRVGHSQSYAHSGHFKLAFSNSALCCLELIVIEVESHHTLVLCRCHCFHLLSACFFCSLVFYCIYCISLCSADLYQCYAPLASVHFVLLRDPCASARGCVHRAGGVCGFGGEM